MKLSQFGTFQDLCSVIGTDVDVKGNPLPLLTVGEMKRHGTNFAIGGAMDELGHMTGEVTMVDGKAYLSTEADHARLMRDNEKVGFVQFANIPPEGTVHKKIWAESPDDLIAQCKALIPEKEQRAFMLRVKGNFNTLDWRGMNNAHHPYHSAEEMLKRSPIHHEFIDNFTLSGFYQEPIESLKGKGVEGWHFHGVSDDREKYTGRELKDTYQARGGHIMGFTGFAGEVDIMPVHEWHIGTKRASERLVAAEPTAIIETKELYCFPGLGDETVKTR